MVPDAAGGTKVGPVGPRQPVVALCAVEDHRHAVMDRREGVIRRTGQDRACAQVVPDRQQAREPQCLLVAGAGEEMRLLGILGAGPLVIAASGDQAAAIAPRPAKTGLGRGLLDPRVNRARAPVLQITPVPARDQAPSRSGQLFAQQNIDLLRRLDVEPAREGRDLELGKFEFGTAQVGVYEASTHRQTMTGLAPILQALALWAAARRSTDALST